MGKSGEQIQGACIFCGKGRLSKQHVIPNWIFNHLPAEEEGYEQNVSFFQNVIYNKHGAVMTTPSHTSKKRNGNLARRTVRNVCIECNGGWISVVENKAKPFLEKMIKGENIALTEEQQECVALALVIITIMKEYTNPYRDGIVIPRSQLRHIKDTLSIPEGWLISVGLISRFEVSRSRQHYSRVARDAKQIDSGLRNLFTTVVLGHLIFQSVVFIDFSFSFTWHETHWLKIWPCSSAVENWRYNLAAFENENFSEIANSMAFQIRDSMSAWARSKG